MALEAGSVFVRIAGLFVQTDFDKADKAVAAQRAQAKDPITYTIGLDDSALHAQSVKARSEVEAGTGEVEVPVGLDTRRIPAEALAARAEIKRAIGSASANDLEISLNPSDRSLLQRLVGAGGGVGGGIGGTTVRRAESGRSGGADDGVGTGHLLGGLLHSPGGMRVPGTRSRMGGFGLGSMIGLGPEHLITALGSMIGVGGGAIGGLGLAASGFVGKEAVGGGSDALVNHETRQNIEAIYKLQQTRNQVRQQYGANSKEARSADATYRQGVKQQVGGTAAERRAESGVASQASGLRSAFRSGSAGAQAESAGIDSQALTVASKFLPSILAAATKNLGIFSKDIKPLFAWLSGPKGLGIFKDLENDFSRNMPTGIHAATQAIEFFLKIIDNAAGRSGKLGKEVDNFFTEKNHESAKQMDNWIGKLYTDMHAFGGLIAATGHLFAGMMHDSAHEGLGLVTGLTKVINKMTAWENSAKGSGELHSFFVDRKKELDQILSSLGPLLKVFFQFYMDMQAIVPGVTDFFKILTKILTPIEKLAGHSKLFNDAFVIPLGIFLLIWKRFGWETASGMVRKVAESMGLLSKNTKDASAAQKALNGEQGAKSAEGDAESDAGGLFRRKSRRGKSGLLSDAEKAVTGSGGHIGGATGMGEPGTRTNPLVVSEIDPKYSGMGQEAKDFNKEEQGTLPGMERDVNGKAPQTALAGFEDAEKAGRKPAGVSKDLLIGAGDAEQAPGLLGGLKKLLGISAKAAPVAGIAEDAAPVVAGAAPEVAGVAGVAGLAGGLGSIAAVAAPIAAVVAAVVGLAKVTGTLGKLKDEVLTPFAGAWKQVSNAIEAIIPNGTKGGNLFKTIASDAKLAWAAIKQFVESPEFKQGFEQFEDVLGVVSKIFAVTFVGAIKQGIIIVTGVIKQFIDYVKGIADIFRGVFKVISGIIHGNAGEIKDGFELIAKGAVSILKATFLDIPEMLLKIFKSMIGTVESYLGIDGAGSKFAHIAESAVSDMKKGFEAMPGFLLSLGVKMVHSLVTGVEDLGSDFLSLGEKLASKIAEGIKNGAIKIGTAVADAAKSAPGKLLHDAGHLATHPWEVFGGARGGHLPGFEGGGRVPGAEFGRGDQMTLVDPTGRPRAKMAGDENIYTRHQRPYVDAGLQAIGFRGGSDELWNTVTTPHSHGGVMLRYVGGPLLKFATGGTMRRTPTTQRTPSGLTTNATLSKFGQGALNAVDRQVAGLDTKYQQQDQIFQLYDPNGYTTKDLNLLMGIRENQWDLLYKEWLTLPAALKSLRDMTYGVPTQHGRVGGIRSDVNNLNTTVNALDTLVTQIGGDSKPSTSTAKASLTKLHTFYKGQTPASIASTERSNQLIRQHNTAATRKANQTNAATANKQTAYQQQLKQQAGTADADIPNGPTADTMNLVYKANAQQMAAITDRLTQVHKKSLGITSQIASLIGRSASAKDHSTQQSIQKQITDLKKQRRTNNDSAITLAGQLSDLQNTNETIAVQYNDGSYYNRMAKAAAETGLTGKTTELELTLRKLRTALANEKALETQAKEAIATVKGKIDGTGGGSETTVQELGDYGYDIMALNQQGAKIPMKYQQEIDKVFKSLGIKLPRGWADAAQVAQQTASAQAFQGFQASLGATFGSFGSNFVSAGANPYKGSAGRYAGNDNYGAASGEGERMAGGGQIHTNATPYGGTSDSSKTEINITQHFGGPPPDPHTYSHGLRHELGSALG
jgi:hypothetical protein